MLDSSSQVLLDNMGPKVKSDSGVASTAGSSQSSSFANYYDNANKEQASFANGAEKSQAANTRSQEQAVERRREKSSLSQKQEAETNNKSNNARRTDNNEQTSSAKSRQTADSESSDSKDQASQASANNSDTEKVNTQQTAQDSDTENLQVKNLDDDKKKTVNFAINTDLIIEADAKEKSSVETSALTNTEDNKRATLQELVARILQAKQLDEKQMATAKEFLAGNVEQSIDAAKLNMGEISKNLLPEMLNDSKAKNTLQKHLLMQQNENPLASKKDALAEILKLEEQGDSLLKEEKVEEFVAKVLDKLNMNKSNLETLIAARSQSEKAQFNNEFFEQLSTKLNVEGAERAAPQNPLLNAATTRGVATTPPQFTLNTHINQPEWGNEFGKRIQFMMNNNIQSAELRLDPPELGKISVKINMSSEQANVTFTSAHQNVREIIESTLPRLRELLAESGLQLGNTDVASQFQQQTNERGDEQGESNLSGPVLPEMDELGLNDVNAQAKQIYSVDGMIDYFA